HQIDFLLSVLRVRSGSRPDIFEALHATMGRPGDAAYDAAAQGSPAVRPASVGLVLCEPSVGPDLRAGRERAVASEMRPCQVGPENEQPFSLDLLTPGERDLLEATARNWIKDALDRDVSLNEPTGLRELRTFVRQLLVPRLLQCEDELKRIIAG